MPCVPPAGRARGFTLIEILIAMVVLMIGLVGIMSVFPAGMRQANDTVEKSYAAAIAQSVVDAIRLGLRQARVATEEVDAFLFVHDGVRDLADDRQGLLRDLDLGNPAAVQAALATLLTRDYCIVLPRPEETQTGPGGGSVPRAFLYPRAQRGRQCGAAGARIPHLRRPEPWHQAQGEPGVPTRGVDGAARRRGAG
ncbi:MAG: hypothetical protein KatS3mg102_2878 [Planctomycetota bacterium]|nr:MAG: hypothetical protein KatS3mg102_2878 [Planctomycetota bacterium]